MKRYAPYIIISGGLITAAFLIFLIIKLLSTVNFAQEVGKAAREIETDFKKGYQDTIK